MRKNILKKSLSLLLASVLAITCMSTGISALAYGEPYLDENGNFVRLCDGEWVTYCTSYDEILATVKDAFMQRKSSVSIRFACTDNKELCYDYSEATREKYYTKFVNKVFRDVIMDDDSDDPFDGEYLYHSLTGALEYYCASRPNDSDYIDGKKYTNYTLSFSNVDYYTTFAQENEIKQFVETFNEVFDTASYTDYEVTKLIYDFVVRNTQYDDDVFHNKYSKSSKRYKNSHSAIGAIKGNLLDLSGNQTEDFNWETTNLFLNEGIISKADQGLSVCEGISKLFYVLCESNGVDCKIINGDYTKASGKASDPHEWVEVYLDDDVKDDGARWYLIDPTFAIQRSVKAVHYNNYDYFLKGTESEQFNYKNHQEPFEKATLNLTESTDRRVAYYDFYSGKYKPSAEDYDYGLPDFSDVVDDEAMILIERSYFYNGREWGAYLLTNSIQTRRVEFDEMGNIKYNEEAEGFVYNGQQCKFVTWIPYVVGVEAEIKGNMVNVGTCSFELYGKDGKNHKFEFEIVPNDMTDNYIEGHFSSDKYSNMSQIEWNANYTGSSIEPKLEIVDGFHNKLKEFRDYDIVYYRDKERTWKVDYIIDIGTYYIDIVYKNNYTGVFSIEFVVGKIDLSDLEDREFEMKYFPKSVLDAQGVKTPADEFVKSVGSDISVGMYILMPNEDFTVSSSGNLSYGSKGTITIKGMESSFFVLPDTKKTYSYKINEKFDISVLDKTWADKNPSYFNGNEIKPENFEEIDKILEKGIDYKIIGYKNNGKIGKASVIIQGIKGCEGTAEMYFQIVDDPNRIDIKNVACTYSNNKNTFKYTLKYNGKKLVKGTDYTEKVTVSNGNTTILCTGINDYKGTFTINLGNAIVAPSNSGNYITISNATYTGKSIKPEYKLYNSSKKQVNNFFVASTTYSNNKNVGAAKVTVKLISGKSVSKSFNINPSKTSISSLKAGKKSFTVKWTKKTTQVTGYQIQYSTSSKFTSPKTITVSKNSTVSYTKSGLSGNKKYYVRIRTYKTVGSKKYYSGWSASKSVKTK